MARSVRVSSLHRLDHQLELFLEFFLQLQVRLIELPGQEQRENDDGQSEKLKPYVEKHEQDRKRARREVRHQCAASPAPSLPH